jgi:predicted alpha/beta-hydrolase family hydrolase
VPQTLRGAERAMRLEVPDIGTVSALALHPGRAHAALALAHGAGAGMRHPFMAALAERLAERGVATLRYQFPYLEHGGRRPDPPAVATATVRAAAELTGATFDEVPLFAGGKSFGGRMSSTAQAEGAMPDVRGLVFFGFPLHPMGRPGTVRATHLESIHVPMLFLQGDRDALADPSLIQPLCQRLGPLATLVMIAGADHSFHVRARSGSSDEEVLDALAETTSDWMRRAASSGSR